jgi:hypothetical protein
MPKPIVSVIIVNRNLDLFVKNWSRCCVILWYEFETWIQEALRGKGLPRNLSLRCSGRRRCSSPRELPQPTWSVSSVLLGKAQGWTLKRGGIHQAPRCKSVDRELENKLQHGQATQLFGVQATGSGSHGNFPEHPSDKGIENDRKSNS